VRNRRTAITAAIGSALTQVGVDLEVVVVDDGSDDGTDDVVRTVSDPRVRLFRQSSSGVTAARNAAARIARGTWLVPLDSDDILLPGALQALMTRAEDSVDVITGGAVDLFPDGAVVERWPQRLGPEFQHVTALFFPGAMAVRADVWQRVGGQTDGLTFGENTEMGMRLASDICQRGRRLEAIRFATVRYAVPHEHHYGHLERAKAARLTIDRNLEVLHRNPRLLATYWSICAVQYARAGNSWEALRVQTKAVRAFVRDPRHVVRLVALAVPPIRRRRYRSLAVTRRVS